MKKIILLSLALLVCGAVFSQEKKVKTSNIIHTSEGYKAIKVSSADAKDPIVDKYTHTDGKVYPVYQGSRGGKYAILKRVRGKNIGQSYKKYMPKAKQKK